MGDPVFFTKPPGYTVRTADWKNGNVSGILASYMHFDMKINLEYFYELDNASTYKQILEEIGEPNGQFGSGMIY